MMLHCFSPSERRLGLSRPAFASWGQKCQRIVAAPVGDQPAQPKHW
jgi:hypothetical protein